MRHPSPLYFFLKNLATFFVASSAVSSLVSSSLFFSKPGDLFFFFFLLIAVTITIAFYCFHSGVTSSRVSPHTFFTCPTWFLHYSFKFAHKIFFLRVLPPWRMSPGAIRPRPLVTPLYVVYRRNSTCNQARTRSGFRRLGYLARGRPGDATFRKITVAGNIGDSRYPIFGVHCRKAAQGRVSMMP